MSEVSWLVFCETKDPFSAANECYGRVRIHQEEEKEDRRCKPENHHRVKVRIEIERTGNQVLRTCSVVWRASDTQISDAASAEEE